MVISEINQFFGKYKDLIVGLSFIVAFLALTGFKLDIPTWFNSLTPEGKMYFLVLLNFIFTLFVSYLLYSWMKNKIAMQEHKDVSEIKKVFESEIVELKTKLKPIVEIQNASDLLVTLILEDFRIGMPKFYPDNGAFHLFKEKILLFDEELQSLLLLFYQKIIQASDCHQQIFYQDATKSDFTKIECYLKYAKEANELIPQLIEKLKK